LRSAAGADRFFGTLTPAFMQRHRAIALLLLVSTVPATTKLLAQSTKPADVGERVRITTASQQGGERIVGSVVAVQGDTLLLRSSGAVAPRPVAFAAIRELEVSFGREGKTARGLLYGGLIGAAAGGAFGAVAYQKPDCDSSAWICDELAPRRSASVVVGAALGAVAGLAVGGLWGATHPTERWIRRPLGSTTRVGIVPARHGATVSLVARF
jgi:hypothetical protein